MTTSKRASKTARKRSSTSRRKTAKKKQPRTKLKKVSQPKTTATAPTALPSLVRPRSFLELAWRLNLTNPVPADATYERLIAERKLYTALFSSLAPRTDYNYTNAVLRFIKFAKECDPLSIPLPADPHTVCLWLASGLGRTGPDTAKGNLSALSAWHKANGFEFEHPPQTRLIKNALALMWPKARAEKPVRPPVIPNMILALHQWERGSAVQILALAVARTAWCGQLRLSEILPETVLKLDCDRVPRRKHWRASARVAGSSTLRLPWTKTTRFEGACVSLLQQKQPFDASSAMLGHLYTSRLSEESLLCEYLDNGVAKVLDKQTFMAMCNEVWSRHGWPKITGHSFRIGGTTALLMAGVNPNIVKKMGRWSSDAYLRYWRTVEEIFGLHAANLDFVDYDV